MYISRIIGLCSYKTLKEVSMSWDIMVGSKELLIVRSRGEEKPSTSVSFVVHRKLWAKVNGTHGYSFLLSVCVFIRAMHAHVRERERSSSGALCEKPSGYKGGGAELKLGRMCFRSI